ncbi:putative hydroxymethylpyrimidine transport system substrate-binding protein [Arboricoccus pini]|uniref:Putative hydroxymethylpyrimidine transport system substrate-binding protein n=1 Tax=Arboricoccus pini TaxID=1963835 RepID=A0A212PZ29_9PROT|nr:ABC transporter substrate-binding protein [Arboricoccus pini]SNB52371.1 putative hydroxymethylpyrimidine transport system substrate-binding protein [Arboricoccus pini]
MRRLALALLLCLLASPALADDKLRVVLDWFVNPDHGPLIVAKQKGFFKAEGLDVELIAPSDPNDASKLTAAKQADIGLSYQPQLQLQVDGGLPLMRIGTLIATPLNCLLVREDSGIRQIADLKGKKIGYSVAGLEDGLIATILKKNGLAPGDVTLVNVNFSLSPALISGQVDAVIGAYRNFELTQMQIEGAKGRCFPVEEEGIPAYDELIYVTNPDNVGRPELKRFMQAVEAATMWIDNHPEEAFDVFKGYAPELDDALNRAAWPLTWPRFAPSPAALDWGRYARFADYLKAVGLIKQAAPVPRYAVDLWSPAATSAR